MPLFEPKERKKARRQVAIRMGKKKVQKYVIDCRHMGERYMALAKQAIAIGNTSQCDQYLLHRIQYNRQANKWESFVLKMEDLILRGQMSDAMSGMAKGLQALTREIRDGVSTGEMEKVMTELNITMEHLEQTESEFENVFDTLDLTVGSPNVDNSTVNIPAEMRSEIDKLRSELMDEVVVQEVIGSGSSVGSTGSGKSVDSRIEEGLDRLRKLKSKTR